MLIANERICNVIKVIDDDGWDDHVFDPLIMVLC